MDQPDPFGFIGLPYDDVMLLPGETDVVPGTATLTLRSDGNDLYAQPDGRYVGRPGVPTGITAEGPELRGATNIVLPGVDHRETAYSARAFRALFRFVTGREPARLDVPAEAVVTLNGRVTSTRGGVQTNRPVPGATVEVFRVDPGTAARTGEARYWTWYDKIWTYSWEHFVDHQYGAWYRILGADNSKLTDEKSPAGKTDYHTMGACYEVLNVLKKD